MATIYAWTGALKKRGELDNLPKLVDFANKLEKACIDTLLSGVMTKDLVNLTDGSVEIKQVNTSEFIKEIRKNLEKSL
jgi:isocitrate dehydrogenase